MSLQDEKRAKINVVSSYIEFKCTAVVQVFVDLQSDQHYKSSGVDASGYKTYTAKF